MPYQALIAVVLLSVLASTHAATIIPIDDLMGATEACRKQYAGRYQRMPGHKAFSYALHPNGRPAGCTLVQGKSSREQAIEALQARCDGRVKTPTNNLPAAVAAQVRRAEARRRPCSIVAVDDEWVARANDFPMLTIAQIRKNRRSAFDAMDPAKIDFNALVGLVESGKLSSEKAYSSLRSAKRLVVNGLPDHDVAHVVAGPATELPRLRTNPWLKGQRERLVLALRKSPGGIMVAPVQTIGYGVTPHMRTALALLLANRIERRGEQTVLDPALVGRAFGGGVRRITLPALRDFANDVDASVMVVPYIGHDKGHRLFARFRIVNLKGHATNRADTTIEFEARLADAGGVIEAADPLFERVAKAVSRDQTDGNPPTIGAPYRKSATLPMPGRFTANSEISLQAALEYQWLAALVPQDFAALRAELFARSLVTVSQSTLSTNVVANRVAARALAELGALPAARERLRRDRSAAGRAYRAFTLGRLAEMTELMAQTPAGLERSLLQLDHARLVFSAYGEGTGFTSTTAAMTSEHPEWAPLIKHKLIGHTGRLYEGIASLLGFIPGPQTSRRANRPVPDNDAAIALIALSGIRNAQRSATSGCANPVQYCPLAAYLDLLESQAVDAAVLPADRLIFTKRRTAEGLAYLAKLEHFLTGHPRYEWLMADIAFGLRQSTKDPAAKRQAQSRWRAAQEYLSTAIEYTNSLIHAHQLPHQSPASRQRYVAALTQYHPPSANHPEAFGHHDDQIKYQRFLQHTFFALPESFPIGMLNDSQALMRLQARFADHRGLAGVLDESIRTANGRTMGPTGTIARANKIIAQHPNEWLGYRRLALSFAQKHNDYDAAARAFMQYPQFTAGRAEKPGSVAKHAQWAGTYFFRRGKFNHARTFFEIALAQDTQNAHKTIAMQHLALIERNYEVSAAMANRLINRFRRQEGLRDSLAWLFAFGDDQQAWDIFAHTNNWYREGMPWHGAQVGARIAGYDWPQNKSWLNSPKHNKHGRYKTPYAAIAGTALSLEDRMPSPQAASDVQYLELQSMVRPGSYRLGEFIDAVGLLRQQQFDAAYDIFIKLLSRAESFVQYSDNYKQALLSYAYYAALHNDDGRLALRERTVRPDLRQARGDFSRYGPRHRNRGDFDFELAAAFEQGLTGKTQEAIAHLWTALGHLPERKTRAIHPAYQWIEACEWLYRDTGKTAFRQMALTLAINYQTIAPYLAWPYAVEASLTTDSGRKLYATAIAMKLDPRSYRLSLLPKTFRQQAAAMGYQLPWKQQTKPKHEKKASI